MILVNLVLVHSSSCKSSGIVKGDQLDQIGSLVAMQHGGGDLSCLLLYLVVCGEKIRI